MHIIVGLGNPTSKYEGTRHNIGFEAIKQIAEDYRIRLDYIKHRAVCGSGYIEGEKVILAQPQTFMNLSGESVRELVSYYKADPDHILVIYDDISLAAGHLRIRKKGSAGGHNGMKNIIACLGTSEFPRIRIGVGEKPPAWDLADYVLGHFDQDERPVMGDAVKRASQAAALAVTEGLDAAMNRFNQK